MKLVFNPLRRETNLNMLGLRSITLALSAVLVIASLVLMVRPGLNLGVDFIGGAQVTLPIPAGSSFTQMQADLRAAHPDFANIDVQAFDEGARFLIPAPSAEDLPQGVSESDYFDLREEDVERTFGGLDGDAVELQEVGRPSLRRAAAQRDYSRSDRAFGYCGLYRFAV